MEPVKKGIKARTFLLNISTKGKKTKIRFLFNALVYLSVAESLSNSYSSMLNYLLLSTNYLFLTSYFSFLIPKLPSMAAVSLFNFLFFN